MDSASWYVCECTHTYIHTFILTYIHMHICVRVVFKEGVMNLEGHIGEIRVENKDIISLCVGRWEIKVPANRAPG